MFLFGRRGYWQELIKSIVWTHKKFKVAPATQPLALSTVQRRAVEVTHYFHRYVVFLWIWIFDLGLCFSFSWGFLFCIRFRSCWLTIVVVDAFHNCILLSFNLNFFFLNLLFDACHSCSWIRSCRLTMVYLLNSICDLIGCTHNLNVSENNWFLLFSMVNHKA